MMTLEIYNSRNSMRLLASFSLQRYNNYLSLKHKAYEYKLQKI